MTEVRKLQLQLAKVRAQLRAARQCADHPHVTLRCAACAGSKGGSVKSEKKTRAARRNWRLAVPSTPSEKESA